jgi:hypothetical protein
MEEFKSDSNFWGIKILNPKSYFLP